MQILAIADNVENWLSDAEMRCMAEESDVVITLGDMYGCDLDKVTVPGTPVVGVYGNHCRPDYISALGGVECAGSKYSIAAVSNTVLGTTLGVNGCVRYNRNIFFQHTQDEYTEAIRNLPAADIVLSHTPPLGTNDNEDPAHVGIRALRDYVDEHSPRHLFHGHTYPHPVVEKYRNTAIHYVSGYALLTI